ncbi:MAG: RNA polymerase sigma factor [Ignavibacteria bacterium]|nr:RNA polymerase sigma factor [Ignavibacteria bacterium]
MTYNLEQKNNISEIFRYYSNRLKGFIRNRVKDTEDADDILQDVFYRLIETDKLLKPIENLSAWLFTVARNRITDFYRKKKTESTSDSFYYDSEEDYISEIADLFHENEDTPETRYLQSLVWVELEKALDELPENQRSVFEMHELQGISFKDIAEITGETINTLISRKRYAVLYLRERLNTLYNELINY